MSRYMMNLKLCLMNERSTVERKLAQQLKSPDPRIRKQVIRELAKTSDKTALNALEVLYKGDPDEEVRQMALIAGKYIRRNMANGGAPPAVPSVEDDVPEPPVEAVVATEKPKELPPATKQMEQRGKGYLDEALGYHIKGEKAKALKAMNKALQVNPHLEKDHYFRSVLDNITGLDGQESLNLVLDRREFTNVQRELVQDKKKKEVESHLGQVEKVGWSGAGFDVMIYTMIIIVGLILTLLTLQQMAQNMVNTLNDPTLTEVTVDPELIVTYAQFAEISFIPSLLVGLIAGLGAAVSLLIQSSIIHGVARFIFSGKGSLPFQLHRVASLYNMRLPIMFLIAILGIFLGFAMGNPMVINIVFGALGLFNLFVSFQVVGRIGEAYHFGFLQSCLSLIISGVLLGIIGTILQVAAGAALMQMLMPGAAPAF
jgi:hypothetical protein